MLPSKSPDTREIEIEGQTFTVRGLTRSEALHFTTGYTPEAMPDVPLSDRGDLAETYLLAHGADVTEAEAMAWREATDYRTADTVLEAILELSGLMTKKDADKKDADPQPGTSAP